MEPTTSPTWENFTIWLGLMIAGAVTLGIKLVTMLFNYSVRDKVKEAVRPLEEQNRTVLKQLSEVSEDLKVMRGHCHDIKTYQNYQECASYIMAECLEKLSHGEFKRADLDKIKLEITTELLNTKYNKNERKE